ncbi:MAG: hypothetical protein Q4A51_01720 [Lachnospiraceae bacterium]|nr:hypothetical protein [Lachnospiraceae bacterium]
MIQILFKKKLKASVTIEASILVPIALLLVASVMTVVFMLHDRVILSTVSSYEVIDHASQYKDDPQAAEEGILQMLEKRLVTAKNIQTSSEGETDGMSVRAEAEIDVPLGKVQELTNAEGRIETSVNVSNLNRREQLVRYKTICDGLSAITEDQD